MPFLLLMKNQFAQFTRRPRLLAGLIVAALSIGVTSWLALSAVAQEQKSASPADAAWRTLDRASIPPAPPKEWYTTRPSDEEIAEFNKVRAGKALEAARLARDFQKQFPDDPRATDALLGEYNLLTAVVELGDNSVVGEVAAMEQRLVADEKLPAQERVAILINQVRRTLQVESSEAVGPALARAVELLLQANRLAPAEVDPAASILRFAEMLVPYGQADLAQRALKQLQEPGNDPRVIEVAKESSKKYDNLGKPVEMAFTAIDGRKVDLAELKGKVVLINYWATWCGPCVAGLADLKATYEKFKDQDFALIGISFDHKLEPLEKMVKERELVWPQHYDTENEQNRFGAQFGVSTTPTFWLVDRKGNLRDLNARADMDTKIAKLLAEEAK